MPIPIKMLGQKVCIGTFLICLALAVSSCGPNTVFSQQSKNGNIGKNPPKAGAKKMNEKLEYPKVDKEKAFQLLESFVFDVRHGRKVEPRNLDPNDVEEFVRTKIDRSREHLSFGRIRLVIDFYNLRSVVDHFEKLLNRSEKDENEVLQSLESVRIIAEQGDEAAEKRAFAYFEYLVKNPHGENQFEAFTEALGSFEHSYPPVALLDAMKRQYGIFREKGKNNEFLDGMAEQLFSLMNARLPQIIGQVKARGRVSQIPDPAEKIRKLTMIYLGLDDITSPESERWSARLLRRLNEEGQTAAIVDSMRSARGAVKSAGFTGEDLKARQIRDARAVRYFGGELTDDEKALVKSGSPYQIDYLDRDLY